jgi:hypothetical protein
MPPTPSPSAARLAAAAPVPAEWWQIAAALGPLVILVTALIAAYINWRVLKQRTAADKTSLEQKRQADASALEQKTTADNRAEWWRRAQWALDRALDEDESTKALGLATLDVLARSELARKEELELFDIAWKAVTGPDENGDHSGSQEEELPAEEAKGTLLETDSTEIAELPAAVIRRLAAVDSGDDLGDNKATRTDPDEEGVR